VRAAHALFVERGYTGTRMADVGEAAGVAVQMVYFRFHTKAELSAPSAAPTTKADAVPTAPGNTAAPSRTTPTAAAAAKSTVKPMNAKRRRPERRAPSSVASRTATALTGVGLLLLGAWGAIIPFVGPYFDYVYTPNTTWTWTAARGYLEALPGAVTFVAGVVLLASGRRATALLAGLAAAAAGAWFVLGPLLAPLWRSNYIGRPVGSTRDVSVEQIGMFYGLGAAIILLAGIAVGQLGLAGARHRVFVGAVGEPTATAAPPTDAMSPGVSGSPEPQATPARHGWIPRRRRFIAH
jgi:Bacterial regulatory proteins, tetR family